MPGEGHVVFSGPLLTRLNPEELKSVIGRELAHAHLWGRDAGEFQIADRLPVRKVWVLERALTPDPERWRSLQVNRHTRNQQRLFCRAWGLVEGDTSLNRYRQPSCKRKYLLLGRSFGIVLRHQFRFRRKKPVVELITGCSSDADR